VFVSRLDRTRLSAIADDSRLKLKGPVVVSEATLQPSATSAAEAGVVFGPFSAARFNKQSAAQEKTHIAAALAHKESELAEAKAQIEALGQLIDHLRDLHAAYAQERPDAMLSRCEALKRDKDNADRRAGEAMARQKTITQERAQLRARIRELADAVSRLKTACRAAEQFFRRYTDIDMMTARIPVAAAEQQQEQDAALKARAAAAAARWAAEGQRSEAVRLRTSAEARRSDKAHYPETDGGAADRTGTLEDLRSQYKTAEHALASKRDAQQAI
jgi:chromosome segregation ATPase